VGLKSSNDLEHPAAVIFDVDGTLCDVRDVRHYVERPEGAAEFKPNFNRFHSESIACPAHPQVVSLLARARVAGYAVVIVTGREERWSFLTSRWLKEHGIEYDELLMRPAKDFRPDNIIKAEIEQTIARRYSARLAVDDRLDIIEIWQRAGIATSRVSLDGKVGPIEWPAGEMARSGLEWFASGSSANS
jgi:hypothetical protein